MPINNSSWRDVSSCDYQNNILSELVSKEFLSLIKNTTCEKDRKALERQVFFDEAEREVSLVENADPLGEAKHIVTPFLVHQYKNRVLLLSTGKCFSHCRYCFRKSYTARPNSFISKDAIEEVASYLKLHTNINEILISGGDPLTASLKELSYLLSRLREISPNIIFRLCTRAPIFAPSIFSSHLFSILKDAMPLWIIPHINHTAELGESQKRALKDVLRHGIPMQSQTVLLKGINDDATSLSSLFHTLTMLGIKPGYLFQLDAAFGTKHFRVPLDEGLRLWEEVRGELSGLSMPVFAVDLMGGGGKFPLSAVGLQNTFFYDGKETIIKKDYNKVYTYSTLDSIKV